MCLPGWKVYDEMPRHREDPGFVTEAYRSRISDVQRFKDRGLVTEAQGPRQNTGAVHDRRRQDIPVPMHSSF